MGDLHHRTNVMMTKESKLTLYSLYKYIFSCCNFTPAGRVCFWLPWSACVSVSLQNK